ncbi:hypothetical protein MPH_01238 [Macrophomina phaseolina MS6]|uniref:Uncharacterized protein n=1 Tax=Macrophomina phaseolina (strain MS6) TaxID=1126212 RepID=K2SXZ3_MACPH|nr:hypothetical protein MPH_01238 [Macrophomina phaseolina MS6]
MGIWAPSTIAEIKGVQNSIPDHPVAAEETQSQRVILDSRFRGREFNGNSRLWDRTENGTAWTPETHKHTLEENLANEQQWTAPENNRPLPGVGDIRQRLQSSTSFQKEPDAPVQNRADQAPGPDVNPSIEKAYQPQDDTREVRTIDDDSMLGFSESKIGEYLDDDGLQADLEPEIPDLALEIPDVSTEDIAGHGARLHDKAENLDAESFGSKHSQAVSSENRTSQNKHQPAKRNSLANCSVCGKSIFSKLAKVDDPTCISCKNKKQTAEEDSAPRLLITESPEEVWRRRLQPVQQHPSPVGEIRAPQPIREMSRFGQVHQNLHAELSTLQDTEVAVSRESTRIPPESLSEDGMNGLSERYQTATNKAHRDRRDTRVRKKWKQRTNRRRRPVARARALRRAGQRAELVLLSTKTSTMPPREWVPTMHALPLALRSRRARMGKRSGMRTPTALPKTPAICQRLAPSCLQVSAGQS